MIGLTSNIITGFLQTLVKSQMFFSVAVLSLILWTFQNIIVLSRNSGRPIIIFILLKFIRLVNISNFSIKETVSIDCNRNWLILWEVFQFTILWLILFLFLIQILWIIPALTRFLRRLWLLTMLIRFFKLILILLYFSLSFMIDFVFVELWLECVVLRTLLHHFFFYKLHSLIIELVWIIEQVMARLGSTFILNLS